MSRRSWLLLFMLASLSASRLIAQAVSGTIVGTVVDQSGAVVPNAQVTIVLTGQNDEHNTVTNESGNFTWPNLEPGTYTVTVAAGGFEKMAHENIVVETNTTARVDFALTAGSSSQTVTVTAAPALLQTDRADISTNLGSQRDSGPSSRERQ